MSAAVSPAPAPRVDSADASDGTPRVSIIVVSYNTKEMTLACLRSVYEQTARVSFELLVVDNESPDGSAAAIRAEFADREGFRLILPGENLGFAAANNLAAQEAKGELILLLNPDTLIRDGAIDALIGFADEHPEAKVWGGRTVFGDGSLNPSSCWGRQTLWSVTSNALGLNASLGGAFDPEAYGGWDRGTVRRVDIVSGCFFLVTAELWRELGGFDPEFFMYGEEADLCLRAKRRGADPVVTPRATIVHYGGASERLRGEKIAKVMLAKRKLLSRHWPGWLVWYGSLMLLARVWMRWQGYKVGAMLSASKSRGEQAAQWATVWRLRVQWNDPKRRAIETPTAHAGAGGVSTERRTS